MEKAAGLLFRRWLAAQPRPTLAGRSIEQVVRRSGYPVSCSTAYRAMAAFGLRGGRRNLTRFDAFWKAVNWDLPDWAIARAWGVDRSNVRGRRLRLRLPPPRWPWTTAPDQPGLRAAIAAEVAKARRFDGPRPDPARRRDASKGADSALCLSQGKEGGAPCPRT